jgi:hypothetical protein
MYRTGDRVRRRSDGSLDFLGRLDQQIKLRGFRIEPGEIESHLQAHPSVRAAAVAACGDLLVAYVVLSSSPPDIDSLRMYLRARLPAYMVPVKFEILETLPVTANGKIDTCALPSPIYDDAAYVAPRTAVEHTIAGIWAGLCRLRRADCGWPRRRSSASLTGRRIDSPDHRAGPRDPYRAGIGADGMPILDQRLRQLLHLDDKGGLQ